MAAKEHSYAATVTWIGAAAGPTTDYRVYSREYRVEFFGKPAMTGSADPAYVGDARLYNPEDLLLASLSACHLLTYLALCARDKIAVTGYRDEAGGTVAVKDGKMRFTGVVLRPQVTIADAAHLDKARALHGQAHDACFITNSVNFPVEHEPTVTTG